MERIISVAVSAYGVIASLPAPARHPDVLRKLYDFKPPERRGKSWINGTTVQIKATPEDLFAKSHGKKSKRAMRRKG